MTNPTREQILSSQKIEIKVDRNGLIQNMEFQIIRLKGPAGDYPIVKTEKMLPISEMQKLSELYNLPFESKSGRIFPQGKSSKDYGGL